MERFMRKAAGSVLVLLLGVVMLYAGPGSVAGDFLTMGVGAKAVSMGGAFTGLADDVSATYWNPGGLVQLGDSELMTMYNSWFEGSSQLFLGYGKKLASGAVMAGQVDYVGSGDIAGTDEFGVAAKSFSASWMAAGLSYAKMLGDNTGAGVNLKLVNETIVDVSGSGYMIDGGILYGASEKMNLGLSIDNLGSGIQYAGDKSATAVPLIIRGGLSYLAGESLVCSLDVAKISSNKQMGYGVGAEYKMGTIGLRLGANSAEGVMTPSFGVGIKAGSVNFDICGNMNSELGSTYNVAFIGRFGNEGGRLVSGGGEVSQPVSRKAKVSSKGGNSLEAQLDAAIAAEDYAKAEQIKAKIKARDNAPAVKSGGDLEAQLQSAIAAEDYQKASEIKAKIAARDSAGGGDNSAEINKLTKEMNDAIAAEDYQKAGELKAKIKTLQGGQ